MRVRTGTQKACYFTGHHWMAIPVNPLQQQPGAIYFSKGWQCRRCSFAAMVAADVYDVGLF
jgi:hypothetical protein